ncbi:MAG: hypothetical protein IT423_21205 [Pirellulaceae bacterium]|nr:hypothetical protein [Pirellulaceae bacterium]
MSKHIIIDWQRDGLFVAMGSRRGNSVTIDTLVDTSGEGGGNGSSTAISTQLFALAKQLDLHKCEATIIAPREVLEFRSLTVPRGDANEVPDMVRFQAQRQMANIGDTWPLDYILLPDQPGSDGISALAATISPAHMAEIEATCSDLGIQLTRVLARPVEIARWGVSIGNLAGVEAALVIAVSQTHADLLAVSLGSLVQVRGTRLPEDPKVMGTALVAEVRRTIMAAANVLNNQSISKIVLIAAPDIAERVETLVAEATGASVTIVDPASVVPAKLPERHELAQRAANRLAAVAGVVSNPTPDKRNVIDLRNCKRREPKKTRVREMAMAGAGVGILLLGGVYWWWSSHAHLDMAIAAAKDLEKQKAGSAETLIPKIKQREDVDNFLAGSINWLDELSHIAQHAPPSQDVMLSNPTFQLLTDRKGNLGQITLVAEAKNAGVLNELKESLSDKGHEVTGGGPKSMPVRKGDYSLTEKETIRVGTKGWDPLAVPPKKPANPVSSASPSTAPTSAAPTSAAPTGTAPTSAAPATKPTDTKPTDTKPTERAPTNSVVPQVTATSAK